MKILNLIILILISFSCKAQTSIINLEDDNGDEIENAYYKDNNNLLNPFVGTWVFQNGSQYLKIIFEKKVMVNAGNYFEDLLIGEFQYIENGVELVNTLSKLNSILDNEYQHSIDGNYIMAHQSPFNDYTTDNFRIGLTMSEPNGCSSSLDVRTTLLNGQLAIQIFKRGGVITMSPSDPEPPEPFIPAGFYFLIKQ